jgi:hypothetical protein
MLSSLSTVNSKLSETVGENEIPMIVNKSQGQLSLF